MPTPIEIRNNANARLVDALPVIQTRQGTFFAANGRYWQGLRTMSFTPADGETRTPDVGTRTPTDQTGAPWPAAIRSLGMEIALQCDAYDGPLGKGYVLIAQVSIGDRTWERARNEGPETWRTHDWVRLGPDEQGATKGTA